MRSFQQKCRYTILVIDKSSYNRRAPTRFIQCNAIGATKTDAAITLPSSIPGVVIIQLILDVAILRRIREPFEFVIDILWTTLIVVFISVNCNHLLLNRYLWDGRNGFLGTAALDLFKRVQDALGTGFMNWFMRAGELEHGLLGTVTLLTNTARFI